MANKNISLCVICGDSGATTLERLLDSLLAIPDGGLVDEVVIGWNGKDDGKFLQAVGPLGKVRARIPSKPGETVTLSPKPNVPPTLILRQVWKDDFAAARNEVHQLATAPWSLWLDCDDVTAPADSAVVFEAMREAGHDTRTMRAAHHNGRDWRTHLAGIDASGVNVLIAPYHYTIEPGTRRPLLRQLKRRMVRWASGFEWFRPVHEDLRPLPGVQEKQIYAAAFVIEHLPDDTIEDRLARNQRIQNRELERLKALGANAQFADLYNVGTLALDASDPATAVDYLKRAAVAARAACDPTYEHCAREHLTRALHALGKHEEALQEAYGLLQHVPQSRHAYLMIAHAYYQLGRWPLAVQWYDLGQPFGEGPTFAPENVVLRHALPAATTAIACSRLGQHERATKLIEEATRACAWDPTVQNAQRIVVEEKARAVAAASVKKLVRWHIERGDVERAQSALTAAPAWEDRNEVFADVLAELRSRASAPLVAPAGPSDAAKAWSEKHGAKVLVPELICHALPTIPLGTFAVVEKHGYAHEAHPARRTNVESTGCAEAAGSLGRVERLELLPESNELAVLVTPGRYMAGGAKIVVYAPSFVEPWGPEWVDGPGLGGSEEAIVYLTEVLAARGYRVVVYGPQVQPTTTRFLAGVEWRRVREFDPKCFSGRDVLVAHRSPWIRKLAPTTGLVYVWHHDHYYTGEEWIHDVPHLRHLFVSNWQAQVLGGQARASVLAGAVIENGVPGHRLEQVLGTASPERDPHRVAYLSQPIRGLDRLLDLWPRIREKHPDARLHIFYGWDVNEKLGLADSAMAASTAAIKARVMALPAESGVVIRGRTPHADLMKALSECGVWAYPTGYAEVSCIAGLRAALAGCIPVFMTHGNALGETQPVKDWAVAKPWENGGEEAFFERLLQAMEVGAADPARKGLQEAVLATKTWSHVADRLLADLSSVQQGWT